MRGEEANSWPKTRDFKLAVDTLWIKPRRRQADGPGEIQSGRPVTALASRMQIGSFCGQDVYANVQVDGSNALAFEARRMLVP